MENTVCLFVNKKEVKVEEGCTVEKLLEILGYSPRSSVWVNGNQLYLRDYSHTVMREQDQVKIIRILGGG
ncbi:sulfur carrier protein [Tindallia magadiensis]|uniref:Sulfur carrier protein n=1 Tax=Tindallia magadiensis TaxID=69895 RepID=A0A1I3EMQ7_9FIRM|nr:sulfur carrier protein ThiS [Tindallia magadiensis]SFI00090.1 sulfur carrier protein [Tindallia magadiensis]